MWKAGIEPSALAFLSSFADSRSGICEGNDLIILPACHHKRGNLNLLRSSVKSVSEKALMQSYWALDPSHHSLPPPIVPHALRNGCSRTVVAVEEARVKS